jgi:SAM-dependent methyltransferase
VTPEEPTVTVLDLCTWARPANGLERMVLRDLRGPVLEVGCGPGRLVAALAEAGTVALGIDTSPFALELAARRGASTYNGSIFGPVPDEGCWESALLVDGSIGIGGDPVVLLRRVHAVLRPGGIALVEVRPPGAPSSRGVAAVEHALGTFETIAWAELGVDQLHEVAARAGFDVERRRRIGARWFGWLRSTRAA